MSIRLEKISNLLLSYFQTSICTDTDISSLDHQHYCERTVSFVVVIYIEGFSQNYSGRLLESMAADLFCFIRGFFHELVITVILVHLSIMMFISFICSVYDWVCLASTPN